KSSSRSTTTTPSPARWSGSWAGRVSRASFPPSDAPRGSLVHVTLDGTARELRTVWLEDGLVKLIDQRYLPFDLRIYEAKNTEDVAVAIEDMVVRGAPAIGATAAYGLAQAGLQGLDLKAAADRLRKTRPTGQDLFFAIEYMLKATANGGDLVSAANRYAEEDIERCRKIGEHGAKLILDGTRILTHCNAGALAAVDYGTAMAPMRVAKEQGRRFFVYVDETRPRLQGARLTSWELLQEGIDHAIITDEAAAAFDVTPAKYITGFITETGVWKPAQLRSMKKAPSRPKKAPSKKGKGPKAR